MNDNYVFKYQIEPVEVYDDAAVWKIGKETITVYGWNFITSTLGSWVIGEILNHLYQPDDEYGYFSFVEAPAPFSDIIQESLMDGFGRVMFEHKAGRASWFACLNLLESTICVAGEKVWLWFGTDLLPTYNGGILMNDIQTIPLMQVIGTNKLTVNPNPSDKVIQEYEDFKQDRIDFFAGLRGE